MPQSKYESTKELEDQDKLGLAGQVSVSQLDPAVVR